MPKVSSMGLGLLPCVILETLGTVFFSYTDLLALKEARNGFFFVAIVFVKR